MEYKYGEFSENQIAGTKERMRKRIYFLLCAADPNMSIDYPDVDLQKAFDNLLREFGGLNSLLYEPQVMVEIMSLLEAAYLEVQKGDRFDFQIYRKLVLDAGALVLKIKEV